MGLALARASSAAAEVFARADRAAGFALTELVERGPREALQLTENTQPAVLTASLACLAAAREAGLPPPDFVAGHSLGEFSALVAAHALALEEAVRAVRARGRFMQEAVPVGEGSMAAVLQLAAPEVVAACAEARAEAPGRVVVAANFNGPEQTVVAGHQDRVLRAGELCLAKGARRVVPLPVSAPFHSPLVAPAAPRLAEVLASLDFSDAAIPVVTNVTATPETAAGTLRSLLVEQVTAPVRWTEIVARLWREGCDTFLELGPGAALTGLVRRQLPQARALPVSDPTRLAAALEALAT